MTSGILIGWRVPFSERGGIRCRAHLLVKSRHRGLAYKACEPGYVVNPALAQAETEANPRCRVCAAMEAKQLKAAA